MSCTQLELKERCWRRRRRKLRLLPGRTKGYRSSRSLVFCLVDCRRMAREQTEQSCGAIMKLVRFGNLAPRSRDSSTIRVGCATCRMSSPTSRPTTCRASALEKIAAISPSKLPLVAGAPRLGVPIARRRKIRRDRSELRRSCRGSEPSTAVGAHRLSESDHLAQRSERPRHHAEGTQEVGLGGRARNRDRHASLLRGARRRARSRRRLLRRERRQRARVPDGTRRYLGQGEGLRQLRARRSVVGDDGRDLRSAGARPLARRQRTAHAAGQHADDDLRLRRDRRATSAAS